MRVQILMRDSWRCQWPGCGVMLKPGKRHPRSAVVDHKIKAKDRPDLQLNSDNLWSLCKHHHDSAKQQEERLGYSPAVGPDGYPIDPKHPSNRKAAGIHRHSRAGR